MSIKEAASGTISQKPHIPGLTAPTAAGSAEAADGDASAGAAVEAREQSQRSENRGQAVVFAHRSLFSVSASLKCGSSRLPISGLVISVFLCSQVG